MKKNKFTVATALTAFLIGFTATALANETVTVDLGTGNKKGYMTHRASGFHGGITDTLPGDDLYIPMKARLIRNSNYSTCVKLYERTKRVGAIAQCNLRSSKPPPTSSDEAMQEWKSYVYNSVYDAVHVRGWDFQWDIWNEPGNPEFFGGTWPDFYKTWKAGYDQIKRADPGADVVGPSMAMFDFERLKEFLNYCKDNHCLPTVLSWHELNPGGQGITHVNQVKDHINQIKSWMTGNGIAIDRFSVNEWAEKWEVANPGKLVMCLTALEEAPASLESAAHTYWEPYQIKETCDPNVSPIGRLGLELGCNFQPRCGWYTLRSYGELAGDRQGVQHSATVSGLATIHRVRKDAQALIGRRTYASAPPITVDIRFTNIPGDLLHPGNKARLVAWRIPDYDLKEIDEDTGRALTVKGLYPVSNGQLTVGLPNMWAFTGYKVRLFKKATRGDYDGDGVADLALARPNGTGMLWSIATSSTLYEAQKGPTYFGLSTDTVMNGDYDGDGKCDYAIYRDLGTSNTFRFLCTMDGQQVNRTMDNASNYDEYPVSGDYDGDGVMDMAVARHDTSVNLYKWYILKSSSWFNDYLEPVPIFGRNYYWSSSYAVRDYPISGDYDGDGKTDIAIYRPGAPKPGGGYYPSVWHIRKSTTGEKLYVSGTSNLPELGESYYSSGQLAGDLPISGDFDGDGKTDIAIFRYHPTNCLWRILWSSTGYTRYNDYYFGQSQYNDKPVVGDVDGDGKWDFGVLRPNAASSWYMLLSTRNFSGNYETFRYGNSGYDVPVGNQGQSQ